MLYYLKQNRRIVVLTVKNESWLGGLGAVDVLSGLLFPVSEHRPGSGLACRSHVTHRHSAHTHIDVVIVVTAV